MRKRRGCLTCLIGCGVVLVLAVIFVAFTTHWLFYKKGQFAADFSIQNPDQDLYAHVWLQPEDTVFVDFLTQLTAQVNAENPLYQQMPFLEAWSRKSTRRDIERLLPLKMELGVESEADLMGGTVGFSLYNNLARIVFAIVKRAAQEEDEFFAEGDQAYIKITDERDPNSFFFFSLHQNTAYVANRPEAMVKMIQARQLGGLEADASFYLNGLDTSRAIYGYIRGHALSLDWLRQAGITPLHLEDIAPFFNDEHFRRVAFDMDVLDPETVGIEIHVDIQRGSEREAIRQALEMFCAHLGEKDGVTWETEITDTPEGFLLGLRISGLGQALKDNFPSPKH